MHPNLAVPVDAHKGERWIDGFVYDRRIDLVAIDYRFPIMRSCAAQRIDADVHPRRAYRSQVNYTLKIRNVVTDKVVTMSRRGVLRPGERYSRHPQQTRAH